jgi:hypothetical protein
MYRERKGLILAKIFTLFEISCYGFYDYYIQKASIIKNVYTHIYNANRQSVVWASNAVSALWGIKQIAATSRNGTWPPWTSSLTSQNMLPGQHVNELLSYKPIATFSFCILTKQILFVILKN